MDELYNVRPLNDGNERMVVVEIDCLPRPICLINCYMPTFGYPDTSEKFQDNLDRKCSLFVMIQFHVGMLVNHPLWQT
jgi:hypothetical protein